MNSMVHYDNKEEAAKEAVDAAQKGALDHPPSKAEKKKKKKKTTPKKSPTRAKEQESSPEKIFQQSSPKKSAESNCQSSKPPSKTSPSRAMRSKDSDDECCTWCIEETFFGRGFACVQVCRWALFFCYRHLRSTGRSVDRTIKRLC